MAARKDFVLRGAGVLVVAGVLAGGGAYVVGSDPEPGTANLWVDTNGGTCTRSASLVAYVDASACSTFDAAHAAASNGDLILIADGDYTAQSMNGPAKSAGAQITIRAENDGEVTVDSLDVDTADQLTFEDFVVTDPSFSGGATAKIIDLTSTGSLIFDGVDIDRAWKVGDGLGITRDVNGLTFRNGSICCAKESKLVQMQQYSGGPHFDIVFENVDIHDTVYANNPISGDPHFECMWMDAVTGFTMRNTRVWNCGSSGNIWDDTGQVDDVLFSNTVWEAKRGGTSMVDVIPGSDTGYLGNENLVVIDGNPAAGSTGVIEYSIIEGDLVKDSGWSSLTFRGNITKFQSCGPVSPTYVFNRHTDVDCSASDVEDATAMDSGQFVDDANHDWHPSGCSVPQINAGDTSSYPATDFDGVARYLDSAPEQGPFEKDC